MQEESILLSWGTREPYTDRYRDDGLLPDWEKYGSLRRPGAVCLNTLMLFSTMRFCRGNGRGISNVAGTSSPAPPGDSRVTGTSR